MAECCKPIPGDSVVGYKDPASHRIIVHKSNCKELDRLAQNAKDFLDRNNKEKQ